MEDNWKTLAIKVGIAAVILLIAGYLIVAVVEDQVRIWDKFQNAPYCNSTSPLGNESVGICKITNTSWIYCEYPNVNSSRRPVIDFETVGCKNISINNVEL
jgi:hypothetical protein